MTTRKLLSLTGGGYRGLLTVSVLAALETRCNRSLHEQADVITGTSIGGIIALGLSAGLTATQLKKGFIDHGKTIFKSNIPSMLLLWMFPKYGQNNLREAIVSILGASANKKLSEIKTRVAVTAIKTSSAQTLLITNMDSAFDDWTVLDAALATSAAPYYFPQHVVGNEKYIDGGLSCNVPELAVIAYLSNKYQWDIDDIHTLSIGTGYQENSGSGYSTVPRNAGISRWGKHLVELIMDSQRNLVLEQCNQFLTSNRYIRLDVNIGNKTIDLDDTSNITRKKLETYAESIINTQLVTPTLQAWLL